MSISKINRMALVLLGVASILSLAACVKNPDSATTQATAATSETTASSAQAQDASGQTTTLYGQVTAIDGTKITLALGTFSDPGEQQPDDSKQEKPATGSTSTDKPDSQTGKPSANQQPDTRPGNGFGGPASSLTMTGETKTIDITDESILVLLNRGGRGGPDDQKDSSQSDSNSTESTTSPSMANASISDIVVGSILKVTYDNNSEKLTKVVTMPGGERLHNNSQETDSTQAN